mmetsp:Transcript_106757/g.205396  ORF Transcript_106757/g.205396 Transcript_106757/m.205396 type:complete len:233 (-) Transcript_106757:8-706(-)
MAPVVMMEAQVAETATVPVQVVTISLRAQHLVLAPVQALTISVHSVAANHLVLVALGGEATAEQAPTLTAMVHIPPVAATFWILCRSEKEPQGIPLLELFHPPMLPVHQAMDSVRCLIVGKTILPTYMLGGLKRGTAAGLGRCLIVRKMICPCFDLHVIRTHIRSVQAITSTLHRHDRQGMAIHPLAASKFHTAGFEALGTCKCTFTSSSIIGQSGLPFFIGVVDDDDDDND